MVHQFLLESPFRSNIDAIINHTVINVVLGLKKLAKHDVWIDKDCYCLCRDEYDSDGEKVYTAYQLWVAPEARGLAQIRRLVKFLTFYAQKQKYKRLYIPSSRVDHIEAYARGLGNDFKIKNVVFVKEL
jgi:hypothetical protein